MKNITLVFQNGGNITIDYTTAINSIFYYITTYDLRNFDDEGIISLLDIPKRFIEKVSENENDDIIIRVNDEEDFNDYILYGLKEKIEKEINSQYV